MKRAYPTERTVVYTGKGDGYGRGYGDGRGISYGYGRGHSDGYGPQTS